MLLFKLLMSNVAWPCPSFFPMGMQFSFSFLTAEKGVGEGSKKLESARGISLALRAAAAAPERAGGALCGRTTDVEARSLRARPAGEL